VTIRILNFSQQAIPIKGNKKGKREGLEYYKNRKCILFFSINTENRH